MGVGDGGTEGLGDGVGEGVGVDGGAVGLAVAGATVIVGSGVDVTMTGGVVQVSANSAQTANSSGRLSVRSGRMLGGPTGKEKTRHRWRVFSSCT